MERKSAREGLMKERQKGKGKRNGRNKQRWNEQVQQRDYRKRTKMEGGNLEKEREKERKK